MVLIIGVRFRKSGKVYYFDPLDLDIKKNDHVIVETARGVEYGTVVLAPKEVEKEKIVQPLKPVMRIATPQDDATSIENEKKEKEAYNICLEKITKHNLEMKLIDSEYTFDRNKLLFYFTADGRIDFRELVKDLAAVFRTRIELRQIGVRDETKMIGGIAICGRPLCCHTFLSDFAPVSIKMAKEQNLSLNPAKISGVCGRLMCCLKNEEEAYEYLNKTLPHVGTQVSTIDGFEGEVQSVSVLKQRVKVIVTIDNEEKEVREYDVDELNFDKGNRPSNIPIAPIIPDEVIDEKTIKELEDLEQKDLEDSVAEEADNAVSKNSHRNNHSKKSYRDNRNKSHSSADYFAKDNSDKENRAKNHSSADYFAKDNSNKENRTKNNSSTDYIAKENPHKENKNKDNYKKRNYKKNYPNAGQKNAKYNNAEHTEPFTKTNSHNNNTFKNAGSATRGNYKKYNNKNSYYSHKGNVNNSKKETETK